MKSWKFQIFRTDYSTKFNKSEENRFYFALDSTLLCILVIGVNTYHWIPRKRAKAKVVYNFEATSECHAN